MGRRPDNRFSRRPTHRDWAGILPLTIQRNALELWYDVARGATLDSASISNDTLAMWTPSGSSPPTRAQEIGGDPAGGDDAIKLTDTVDAGPETHSIIQAPTNLVAGPYMFEFWVKPGTVTACRAIVGGVENATFDLSTATQSGGTATTLLLSGTGGDWQHWRVTSTYNSSNASIYMVKSGGVSYQGDGTGTLYIGTGSTYGPVLTQDRVAGRTDQSGKGNNLSQATDANQPIYREIDPGTGLWIPTGQGGVAQDYYVAANSHYMRCDSLASAFSGTDKPYTVVALLDVVAATAGTTLLSMGNSGNAQSALQIEIVSGPVWQVYRREDATGTSTSSFHTAVTGKQLVAGIDDAANSQARFRVGSSVQGPTAYTDRGAVTLDECSIGSWLRGGTNSQFFDMRLRELVVYSTVLTQEEVRILANGMIARAPSWGVGLVAA